MSTGERPTFGAVLDELCLRPPTGRAPYTNLELVRTVSELGGTVTHGYLSLLRKGERDNPTLEVIEYLAAALGVCPAAFVGGRRERVGPEKPRGSFSAKLNHLFTTVYPPNRAPYTPEEVAKAITAKGTHGSISSSYIRELLHPAPDVLPNPRLKHIVSLGEHFGLSDQDGPQAAYFLDDVLAAKIDADLADFAAMRDAGVIEFVTRMATSATTWRPDLRRQVVESVTAAMDGEAPWVFRSPTKAGPEAETGNP